MRRILPLFVSLALSLCVTALPAAAEEARKEPLPKPDVLGEESVSLTEPLSKNYDAVVVRDFSAEGAEYSRVDEEERPRIDKITPLLVSTLGESLVSELKERKLFKSVSRNGEAKAGTVVLEGKFTEFNAGSRALKMFVGFGAGKAYLKVSGRLLDGATGKELASFEDRETGYMGSLSMLSFEDLFPNQAKSLGVHIAEFVEKLH